MGVGMDGMDGVAVGPDKAGNSKFIADVTFDKSGGVAIEVTRKWRVRGHTHDCTPSPNFAPPTCT